MSNKAACLLAFLLASPLLAGVTIDRDNKVVSVGQALAQGLHASESTYRVLLPSGLEWQGGPNQRPSLSQDGSERKEEGAQAVSGPEGWVGGRRDLEELQTLRRAVADLLEDAAALPDAEWAGNVQTTLSAFMTDTQDLAQARPARARRAK